MKDTIGHPLFSTRNLALLASLGALALVVADYLLEFGERFGSGSSIVTPAWLEMAPWRFPLSLNLAAFFIPLYLAGFIALYRILRPSFPRAGFLVSVTFAYGVVMGAPLVHGIMCMNPIIYRELAPDLGSTAATLIEGPMLSAMLPLFLVHYILTWVIAPCALLALILSGKTGLPRWTAIWNPFLFLLLGIGMAYAAPDIASWLAPGSINKGNLALFLTLAYFARPIPPKNALQGSNQEGSPSPKQARNEPASLIRNGGRS